MMEWIFIILGICVIFWVIGKSSKKRPSDQSDRKDNWNNPNVWNAGRSLSDSAKNVSSSPSKTSDSDRAMLAVAKTESAASRVGLKKSQEEKIPTGGGNRKFTDADMEDIDKLYRSELKDLFVLLFKKQGYEAKLNPYRYRNSPDLLLQKGERCYEAFVFDGVSVRDRDWEQAIDVCGKAPKNVVYLFLTNAALTNRQKSYAERHNVEYIERKGLQSLLSGLQIFASDVNHHM